ncbi:MAG: hypothetical protein EKK42_15070 [Pseudonocardiaceae bacterium]|nr:MAG: hypothetical protein EKK42_15070 [Pseudonocardiaceae bacterium]
MGFWDIDGEQAYGSLAWDQDRPVLQITFTTELDDPPETEHVLLQLTKPPLQPKTVGKGSEFGCITLQNCCRFKLLTRRDYASGRTTHDLFMMPTKIWFGSNEANAAGIRYITAQDTRLCGFFGSPGMLEHRNYSDKNRAIFNALGNPHSILSLHPTEFPTIKVASVGIEFQISTSVLASFSATEGSTLQSALQIAFTPTVPTSMEDALSLVSKFEQILTVFSLEHFRFQAISLHTSNAFNPITLAWQLGDMPPPFEPPMRHQVLVDLSDAKTLQKICDDWFDSSPIAELSRWLFCRALEESDDGIARFVGVAQALEVMGRELSPQPTMSRNDMARVEKIIRATLQNEFENEFIERIVGLIRSSNSKSFRSILQQLLSRVEESKRVDLKIDVAAVSKEISDVRNAIVHMTTSKKGALDQAFRRVNKLSLLTCFWYALIQAVSIDVDIPDIMSFLFNNRNARHGLPNEILEKH